MTSRFLASARVLLDALRLLAPSMAWATLGTVFNQGSTFGSNVWIANVLGKTTFGEFAIVLSTVQAAAGLASLGLGYTTTRYLAEWRHRDVARAGQLLGMFSGLAWMAGILAATLLAAGSSGIANGALRAPALAPALLLAAASTVFTVRNGFLVGALSGLEAFRSIGTNGVISGIAYLVLTVTGARVGGVNGAAVGLFLSALLQCVILSIALQMERRKQGLVRGRARFSDERPLLLRFALPAAISGFSTIPVLWAVQAFLARSPQGFGDLAVYTAGLNLLAMVLLTPTVVNGVSMSWINRMQVVGGDAAYRSAIRSNLGVNLLTVSGALVAMMLVGPTLLGLYGRDFRTGTRALILLLVAAVPEAMTNALNQSLQTRERMWESVLAVNLPRDIVMVAAAFALVPSYGAVGAAAAYLGGRIVALCTMYLLVRSELQTVRTTREAVPAAGVK